MTTIVLAVAVVGTEYETKIAGFLARAEERSVDRSAQPLYRHLRARIALADDACVDPLLSGGSGLDVFKEFIRRVGARRRGRRRYADDGGNNKTV